jgi:hypothetical protein
MRWRGWFSVVTLAVAALATMASCHAWRTHRETAASAEPVYAWILCEECDRGERAHVVALGDTAVPLLRTLLLDGAPADRKQRMQAYLAPLRDSGQGRRPATAATVAGMLSHYDMLYRAKAASALSAIGGANALRALCDARKRDAADPVVEQVVDSALARWPGGGRCL